ncbi:hypothetical protein KY290_035661 [Solanum tuberosum]|uniref:SWIM-type domain-containing protein n=1 Tax=Solanum tuberosum TaxID=4113 RepID=A0ABQ7TR67_SOLTU|nr:hypothetical protein KY290_035661 [Solanum tuberosum]
MNITILLRHSGIWVSDVNYEGYKVDGIVVGESISFMNLKALILAELEIDGVRKDIEIRYIVDGNTCPLKIRNDMGVKLYLEVRRNETGIGMYPLCIDTTEKMVGEIHNFDCSSGEIICVEGTERDTEALALVESRICDLDYIPELNATNYITDSNCTDVKTGQLYKDKGTLIAVMEKYKIKNNFNFRVKRSDKRRSSCRKKSDVFKVRYFNNEHMCPMRDRILTKVQATVGFISGVTAPKLFNHKRIHTPQDVIEDIRAIYGVEISYQQAWRAKERALEMLKGKPLEGYKHMPRYIWMLNNVPVVVVDAAHLGGAYKGTFVSASTLDGAGCIFPLAYGVVDTENDCSWTWFFEQFKNAFGERENMCIVSDRNESIMKSVSIVFPNVPHCACIWHLWKNVCSNFKRSKNTLSDIFSSMAKAYRKEDFDKLMAKVVKVDHRVKDYLEDAGYEKWSRVHSIVNRGRMMTSNIAECINGCLVDARRLTIIDFLEEARLLFGSWNYKNKEIASYTKETLGRRFEEVLIVNASKSSNMKVVPSSEYIFSVYQAGRRYIVCLERKICTCGRFQYDEIPCEHAIAVLKHKNVTDMHPYCSDYYKPDALEKPYEVPMVPMPDKEDWTVPDYVLDEIVLPPRYRRLAGRPRNRRKKNADEKITVNKNSCGQCGQEGHNRRTCTFFPKEN